MTVLTKRLWIEDVDQQVHESRVKCIIIKCAYSKCDNMVRVSWDDLPRKKADYCCAAHSRKDRARQGNAGEIKDIRIGEGYMHPTPHFLCRKIGATNCTIDCPYPDDPNMCIFTDIQGRSFKE